MKHFQTDLTTELFIRGLSHLINSLHILEKDRLE